MKIYTCVSEYGSEQILIPGNYPCSNHNATWQIPDIPPTQRLLTAENCGVLEIFSKVKFQILTNCIRFVRYNIFYTSKSLTAKSGLWRGLHLSSERSNFVGCDYDGTETTQEEYLKKESKTNRRDRRRRPLGIRWSLSISVSPHQTPLCLLMTPQRAIQCWVKETTAEDHRGGPSSISVEL